MSGTQKSKRERLSLKVTLLEDLHSGTGISGGTLDSVQIRDCYGRPTIRATHVRGVLRQAGYELLELSGDASLPDELKRTLRTVTEHVVHLFGAKAQQGSLMLESLRCKDEPETIAWTATARNLDDRAPRDDTLRTTEFVRVDTVFEGELECDDAHRKLLEACIKRMSFLGSSRTRGSGLVKTAVYAAAEREGNAIEGQRGIPAVLRLLLVNRDPLRLPITGVPDNIIRTECYIRGQRLLGAMAHWAIGRGIFANNLLDGCIEVGSCYPLPVSAAEARSFAVSECDVIPIPLDCPTVKPPAQAHPDWPWWAEEGRKPDAQISIESGDAAEMAAAAASSVTQAKAEEEPKSKRPGDHEFLFRVSSDAPWQRYAPRITVHMRNDAGEARRSKQPREDSDQNLFSNEEIAEDTVFLADIVIPEDATEKFLGDFAPILERRAWLRMGRGGSPVEVVRAVWHQRPQSEKDGADNLYVRLTSDCIARGPHLGFYDTLTPAVLVQLAVKDEAEREHLKGLPWTCDGKKSTSDWVEVHGFNAASGLPRAAALAIRRGSTLVLTGPADGILSLRASLAANAVLGERTSEGFGRFRMDIGELGKPQPAKKPPNYNMEVADREHRLSEALELTKNLVRKQRKEDRTPSTSQWMALSNALQAAGDENALKNCVLKFREQAEKAGGKAWLSVDFSRIENVIGEKSPKDAKLLLYLAIADCAQGAKKRRLRTEGAA